RALSLWTAISALVFVFVPIAQTLQATLPEAIKAATPSGTGTTIQPNSRTTGALIDVIRASSDPDERIFVFGVEPALYLLSGRQSSTPYVYVSPLLGIYPGVVDAAPDAVRVADRRADFEAR